MRRHAIWLILTIALTAAAPVSSASAEDCEDMQSSALRDNEFYVEGPSLEDPTKLVLRGFATLIESRGLLVTARHVIGHMSDANAAEWGLVPVTNCKAQRIPFQKVLTGVDTDDTHHGSDWALLFSPEVGQMNLSTVVRFKTLDEGLMSLSRVVGHVMDNSRGSEPGPFRGVNPPNELVLDKLPAVGQCTPQDLHVASFGQFRKGDSGAPVIDSNGAIFGIATEFSHTLPEALAEQVSAGESIVSWISKSDLPGAADIEGEITEADIDLALSTDKSVHDFSELLNRMGLVLVTPISCIVEAVLARGPMDTSSRPFDIARDSLARRLVGGDATPDVSDKIRELPAPEWLQYIDLVDGYQRWFDTTKRAAGSRSELVEDALKDLGKLNSNDYTTRIWPDIERAVRRKTSNAVLAYKIAPYARQIVNEFVERVNAGPIDSSTFMAYSLEDKKIGSPGKDAISAAAKLLADEYDGDRVNVEAIDIGIALILWGLSTSPSELDKGGPYFGTNVTEISKALDRKAKTFGGAAGSDEAAWTVASFGVTFPNSPRTAWDILSATSLRLKNYSAAWYFASRSAFQQCQEDKVCFMSPTAKVASRSSEDDSFDNKKCYAYLRQALLNNVSIADLLSFIGITDAAPEIELKKTVAGPGPGGRLRVSTRDAKDAAGQISEFLSSWTKLRSHQASQSHSTCSPIFPTQRVTVTRTPAREALVVAAIPTADLSMPRIRPNP